MFLVFSVRTPAYSSRSSHVPTLALSQTALLSVSYPWPMLSLSFVSLQHCPYRTGLFNCSVQSKGLGYASLGAYVFQSNVVRMISGLRLYQRRLAGRCCSSKPLILSHVSDETSRSLILSGFISQISRFQSLSSHGLYDSFSSFSGWYSGHPIHGSNGLLLSRQSDFQFLHPFISQMHMLSTLHIMMSISSLYMSSSIT